MKKNLFLAALAGVALVGCAKNEVAQVTDDSQREITFTTPVLALNTKADNIINGNVFPKTSDFSVFAYYSEGDFKDDNATISKYMDNVKVVNGTYNNSTPGEEGGWHAENAYYWPKNTNSKLTFDAYYPTALDFTSTASNGLALNDYVAPTTADTQNDVLFADRAYNKTYSDQTNDLNPNYDGVDIKFNHAMSVVHINVVAADAAAASAIKVKSICLHNISLNGSFSQTLASDWTSVTLSQWAVTYSTLNDYYAKTAAADFASAEAISTTPAKYGDEMIVLPQAFDTSNATIEVVYYIQNGGSTGPVVEQNYTFELKGTNHVNAGTSAQIDKWEMGKRYTYNITFSVNEIFLAPSVGAWDEITVNFPAF